MQKKELFVLRPLSLQSACYTIRNIHILLLYCSRGGHFLRGATHAVFAFIYKAFNKMRALSVGNEQCARNRVYSIDIANGKILFAAQTQSVYCVTLRESLFYMVGR
jgi:hypothetical protein